MSAEDGTPLRSGDRADTTAAAPGPPLAPLSERVKAESDRIVETIANAFESPQREKVLLSLRAWILLLNEAADHEWRGRVRELLAADHACRAAFARHALNRNRFARARRDRTIEAAQARFDRIARECGL